MKKIKILTSLLLTFIIAFSLTGCGEVKKAETAVTGMFNAFKELNFEEARKYVNVDDITSSEDESTANAEVIMKSVFKNLNYEIISSEKVDSNNVVVKTKITATDMKPVMGNFFTKALEYAFSNAFSEPQPTEEETNAKMEEILTECVSQPDLATVTNEVDIKVVKNENKEWEVKVDDAFVNAILGGLSDAVDELNKSFDNAE